MQLKLEYSLVKPKDPILCQKTPRLTKPGLETIMAYEFMVELLKKNTQRWLALAAPQVGCPQRFFVSDFVLLQPGNYECFINPRIERVPTRPSWYKEESCVSLPNIKVRVPRWREVGLFYTTLTGVDKWVHLQDMQARCAQHETDHVNGKLITDYVEPRSLIEIA